MKCSRNGCFLFDSSLSEETILTKLTKLVDVYKDDIEPVFTEEFLLFREMFHDNNSVAELLK